MGEIVVNNKYLKTHKVMASININTDNKRIRRKYRGILFRVIRTRMDYMRNYLLETKKTFSVDTWWRMYEIKMVLPGNKIKKEVSDG